MTIEDINTVAEALVNHLKANGVGGTDGVVGFYPNDTVPTSNLPESFVEVVGNGALSTPVSGFGIRSCSLLLILNVKLPGNGAANSVRESYLLNRISNAVKNPFVRGSYHFSLDKKNLVYSGRSLYSGYSSKTMNFNVKIY